MQIQEKKITEIKPYDKNPRKNDASVKLVANSIQEFGFKVPIVIDKDGVIVAGHTRYKAAKKLKLKTVPCITADDLTDEQIKAFRLADNKVAEASEWDMDLLMEELAGITTIEMDEFGFLDQEEDPDEKEIEDDDYNPQPPEEPKSKLGDIYQLGDHRLMVGDSTNPEDVAKLMNGELADLVVTDPPYNVAISNSKGKTIKNDDQESEAFRKFLTAAFTNIKESLKEGGSFYIWFATREHVNFETALNEAGLTVRQELQWVKNTFVLGRSDYHWQYEPCLYGWKDGAAHYFIDDRSLSTIIQDDSDPEKMNKAELQELVVKIMKAIPSDIIKEKKPQTDDLHPTMKPMPLIARQVRNSSRAGQKVLDLFGGSGTTLMVCQELARICYMMEYDPAYADVIIDRWERLTGEKAVKING